LAGAFVGTLNGGALVGAFVGDYVVSFFVGALVGETAKQLMLLS
jgi:hypothetical protein